jgi:hypothetical protein
LRSSLICTGRHFSPITKYRNVFGVAEVLIRTLADVINRSSIFSPVKNEVKKTLHIAVKIIKLKIKIQISFVPLIFGFIASPSLMSGSLWAVYLASERCNV